MPMRKYVLNDRDREIVQHMAAIPGVTHAQIAYVITNERTGKPINERTLEKHFRKELETGMARMQQITMQSFVEQIRNHVWPATRLALSNYCGMKDGGDVAINANIDNNLNVTFVASPNSGKPIPGPLDIEAKPAQLPPPILEPINTPSAPYKAEPVEAPRTEFDLSDEERLTMGLPVLRYKRKSRAPLPRAATGRKEAHRLDGLAPFYYFRVIFIIRKYGRSDAVCDRFPDQSALISLAKLPPVALI